VWVVGGVVLGAALVFGYRFYDGSRNNRALRAAAQFGLMTDALDANDRPRSRQLADGIIKEYPASPYADQAQLAIARLDVDDGQPAGAVGALTQVMNSSKDTELRHIARLRLARVMIDQGKPDDALNLLAADPPGAFAARVHEVKGDAFHAKKDFKSALTEYQAALEGGDSRSVDAALLQLKIADLGSTAAPTAPSNKATP
jgi:predicted negative regulator of RcsB-dependent stress response